MVLWDTFPSFLRLPLFVCGCGVGDDADDDNGDADDDDGNNDASGAGVGDDDNDDNDDEVDEVDNGAGGDVEGAGGDDERALISFQHLTQSLSIRFRLFCGFFSMKIWFPSAFVGIVYFAVLDPQATQCTFMMWNSKISGSLDFAW